MSEQRKAKTAEELSLLFHTVSQNWAQCDPDAESSVGEAMANINEEAYRSFSAGYQKAYFEGQSHIANMEAQNKELKSIIERASMALELYDSSKMGLLDDAKKMLIQSIKGESI